MNFCFDTRELTVASTDDFKKHCLSLDKIEQLEVLDNIIDASKRFNISLDLSDLNILNGGKDMSKLLELGTDEFQTMVKDSLGDVKTLNSDLQESKATIKEQSSKIEAFEKEKIILEGKISAAQHSIEDQEKKYKELSDAHVILVEEKQKIEDGVKLSERMKKLSESGVDVLSMGKEEEKLIASFTDEQFEPWMKVLSSIKKKENKPDIKTKKTEPKTDLADASVDNLIQNGDEDNSGDTYTGVIRQLSQKSGLIRASVA